MLLCGDVGTPASAGPMIVTTGPPRKPVGFRRRKPADACVRRRVRGGRYWVRTSDLFGVNEARYHCANRPEIGGQVIAGLPRGPGTVTPKRPCRICPIRDYSLSLLCTCLDRSPR